MNFYSKLEVKKDGGWAWLVLLGSFLVQMLIDCSFSMFGIFFVEMQGDPDYANKTISLLSLPGALQTGAFQATGVVAGCMLNYLSYRIVALIGFGLSSVSLVISSFMIHLELFTLTYGFLAGCGFGIAYMVAIITVNFYFERYRAVASGISMSGAGVGYLISGPITKALLSSMSWRRVLLSLGLTNLAFTLIVIVFRPLKLNISEIQTIEEDKVNGENSNAIDSCQNEVPDCIHQVIPIIRIESPRNGTNCDTISDLVSKDTKKHLSTDRIIKSIFTSTPGINLNYENPCPDSEYRVCRSGNDVGHLTNNKSYSLEFNFDNQLTQNKIQIAPLSQIDIFYTGSFKSLANMAANCSTVQLSQSFYNNSHLSRSEIKDLSVNKSCNESFKFRFKRYSKEIKIIDFKLFKICLFNLINALSFFIQLAYFIPLVYLINYSTNVRGIPADKSFYLLVILGITHTLGRIVSGFLANLSSVNLAGLSVSGAITCGLGNLILPSLECFEWLCGYAAWQGFTSAINIPTTSLLLVHYLGLENLTASFGVVNLTKSFACIIGPYAAGFLCELIVHPGTPFYLASGSLFTSAMIHVGFLIIYLSRKNSL